MRYLNLKLSVGTRFMYTPPGTASIRITSLPYCGRYVLFISLLYVYVQLKPKSTAYTSLV